jgi:hypothetical protein
MLVRNAFAIASLKRRGLTEGLESIEAVNAKFLSFYGEQGQEHFDRIESFLESAKPDWNEVEFRHALSAYVEMVVGLMKERKGLQDLR